MSRVSAMALASLVLVGLMGQVTFGFGQHWDWVKNHGNKHVVSIKAVQAICQATDYKDTCIKSLEMVKTPDPKELVRAAFNAAKSELTEVANRSPVWKELENHPKTAQAVKDCRELFQDAIDDFHRSLEEVGRFELHKDHHVNHMLSNLKIWVSATRTYQETCIDGFENTTNDAKAKVRMILQKPIEMSSNGLVIIDGLSSLFSSFNFDTHPKINRHLLSVIDDRGPSVLENDYYEDYMMSPRRLLSTAPVLGHSSAFQEFWPEWIDGFRRKLLASPDLASDLKAKANVVVAQDGSGKYKTIEEALKEIPKNGKESFIIYIKEGVYNEYLVLYKWMTNVVFVGDGPTKTRITNNKNFVDGVKTFKTATLSVLGDFFMAKDIGIENSAGAVKHQAVAFRAQSDKSIFFNCHFDGYQDTLYTHTYRQFYRDCKISGTIDFVFGDAAVFFQNCIFVVRKPLDNQYCIVTAQGRMERHQPTGIIIHKSKFVADPHYLPVKNKNKAYLGRPWKEYSKTIIMESDIDEFIQPDGWLPWEGDFGLDTCYYGEYNNVGAGSRLANRVKWHGVKTIVPSRAEKFMPPTFYGYDDWIRASEIPYEPILSTAPGPTTGVDEDPDAPVGVPSSIEDVSPMTSPKAEGQRSSNSRSSSPSSSVVVQVGIKAIKMRELERILMQNEEMEEDEGATDDMAGNVPDGDEPSPARAESPSPSAAPTPSNNNDNNNDNNVAAPSPSQDDELIPPAVAPAPDEEEAQGEADKAPPTSSKPSSGTKLHVTFITVVMWVALFI